MDRQTKGLFWLWGVIQGSRNLTSTLKPDFAGCTVHPTYRIVWLPGRMRAPAGRLVTGPLPSWKRQCFALMGIDICFGYGLLFVACNASIKPIIHGLRECIIHQHGISHSIAFARGTCFFSKWGVARCVFREFTGNTLFPIMKELEKWWNGILKSVSGPPRQQQFAGLYTPYTLNLG